MNFPVVFEKCPKCGSKDTLYLKSLEDEPSAPKNTQHFLEKKLSPVQDFLSISTPSTKVLIRFYDTCASCGQDRCIRAEKGTVPTDILMQMMGVSIKMPQAK